jgi:nucleotide-binding universal stress UspA family protein
MTDARDIEALTQSGIDMRTLMYQHILIATDRSELAQKAVDHGLALAKALNAKATVVTVTEPWDVVAIPEAPIVFPPADHEAGLAEKAAYILAGAKAVADKMGVACETRHVKDRYPGEGIVKAAQQKACNLIVVASHGRRGFRRMVLGSTGNEVMTHASVPSLICL